MNSPVPNAATKLRQQEASLKKSSSFTIEHAPVQGPKLYSLKNEWARNDITSLQAGIMDHVEYTLARTKYNFDRLAAYQATAYSVRDRLIERFNETNQFFTDTDPKRVYYLSLEFLMGRSLQNSIFNMGIQNNYTNALLELGYRLEDLYEEEKDAALGNGGLGRLAACFMDSVATMKYAAWGYGLRYHYGMFEQGIYDGYQTELPDYWLVNGNPWDIERVDVQYTVRFYGHVVEDYVVGGDTRFAWEGGELVRAVAYDTPVPGYKTINTNNIRLWASKPHKEFDLAQFNEGNYLSAVEAKQRSENITSVLYPNDNTYSGKELRLKQQYFFVAASLSDIIRRFKKVHGSENWELFPTKVAVQLNDTHPSISIVELLRKLIDEEGLKWDAAWPIVNKVFAYTNHTVLPEALEVWPVSLMQHLLPRHMQLIYQINFRFLNMIDEKWKGDVEKQRHMSIIEEGGDKRIRMANLAIVGSHAVNGVAFMHTEIVKHQVFADFYALWPDKFVNITNGVTPRRWIEQANPLLSELITRWLHTDKWTTDIHLLAQLKEKANDSQFQHEWRLIKQANKARLAAFIKKVVKVDVNPKSLFDVHIKRIHEYKRQLLNLLHVVHRYLVIKKTPEADRKNIVPRVVIFAGKAAPGYLMAKRHIKLINSVAEVVNNDKSIDDLLKVVFLPNYSVSMAQVLIPGSDINQQISTAGTEASGTSNMKFAMNGSLIIGTLDGANVEISEEVGQDNMFIFGLRCEQVESARAMLRSQVHPLAASTEKFEKAETSHATKDDTKHAKDDTKHAKDDTKHAKDDTKHATHTQAPPTPTVWKLDHRLQEVFQVIQGGVFGPAEGFQPILDTLQLNDYYLLTVDFPLYLEAQERVDKTWKDEKEWTRKSILNTAGTPKFSSDRSILEYAEKIWDLKPCPVTQSLQRLY